MCSNTQKAETETFPSLIFQECVAFFLLIPKFPRNQMDHKTKNKKKKNGKKIPILQVPRKQTRKVNNKSETFPSLVVQECVAFSCLIFLNFPKIKWIIKPKTGKKNEKKKKSCSSVPKKTDKKNKEQLWNTNLIFEECVEFSCLEDDLEDSVWQKWLQPLKRQTNGDLEDPLTNPFLGDDPEDYVWVGLGAVAMAWTMSFGRRNATIPEGLGLFLEVIGQVWWKDSISQ